MATPGTNVTATIGEVSVEVVNQEQRAENRRQLEYIARCVTVPGGRLARVAGPNAGSGDCVFRTSTPGAALHPPPLSSLRQLALSVLLGEPIPPAVLLGALEDHGVYPDGVLSAADEAKKELDSQPLDMGNPVYDEGENLFEGRLRFDAEFRGWFRSQQAQVTGLCKGVFGSGRAAVGNAFSNFLHAWIGYRNAFPGPGIRVSRTAYPTSEYIRQRIAAFPPITRVFKHLRRTASPGTAEILTRLIDHLEHNT